MLQEERESVGTVGSDVVSREVGEGGSGVVIRSCRLLLVVCR